MTIVSFQHRRPSTKCANVNFENVDDTSEAMDIDGLASTFSAFNVDSDSMTVDEMAIPCMPSNEPHWDDAMEID